MKLLFDSLIFSCEHSVYPGVECTARASNGDKKEKEKGNEERTPTKTNKSINFQYPKQKPTDQQHNNNNNNNNNNKYDPDKIVVRKKSYSSSTSTLRNPYAKKTNNNNNPIIINNDNSVASTQRAHRKQ